MMTTAEHVISKLYCWLYLCTRIIIVNIEYTLFQPFMENSFEKILRKKADETHTQKRVNRKFRFLLKNIKPIFFSCKSNNNDIRCL